MAENFQDNVKYGGSTLGVSGDAVAIGSTNAGAKSVIYATSDTQGHLAWLPTANRTINLPDAGGTVMMTSQAILSLSAGGARVTSGEVVFSNSNGISFGVNGQTVTGSYTVPTVPAQLSVGVSTGGNTAGDTSVFTGRVVFAGGNNITLSGSSNAGSVTYTISGPNTVAQTNQTAGLYAVGNTTQNSSTTLDARTISFDGLGAATVGFSNGSVQISVPTQTAQTQSLIAGVYDGANSISTGTIRFTNANGVSFSINGQTLSASVAAQTNQTVGLYAVSNTTQNSSTTLDARTLSFQGAGIASVGYSNGSIVVSVPTGAPSPVNFSAGTTSNNLGSVVFSNSNGVSFGLNGSTITASAAGGGGAQSLYALGNTTQSSSTTLSSLSFNALGAMTWGYSNGSIQVSAPPTSSLSATGIISISTNGSTISIGAHNDTISAYEPYPFITSSAWSSHDVTRIYFNPMRLVDPVAVSAINVFKSISLSMPAQTSQNSSGTFKWFYQHGVTLFTRQDYSNNSTNLSTFTTASLGITVGLTNSSSSQTAAISWVTDTTGGTTTFSTTSGSNAWSSIFQSNKIFQIPMVTTLPVGEYFIAQSHSSSRSVTTGTNTSANNHTLVTSISNLQLVPPLSGFTFGTVTVGTSFSTSHITAGIGMGVATATTTNNTMPASVISNGTQNIWYVNFSNATAS